MGSVDFPTWFGIGSYGGLACCILAAAGIAAHALIRRRGTPRQIARSILVCLAAGCLALVPIWWNQNRLDMYGPALAFNEVLLFLVWTALTGWLLPFGMLVAYTVLAAPQLVTPPSQDRRGAAGAALFAALDDPARKLEPLGAGRHWGKLLPLEGDVATQPVLLTRQLTLLGRELDNDIVIDDERTSRHHAEFRWDHGRAHLLDRHSMNGTLVNRQSVRGLVLLQNGDIIELGAQRYRLEMAAVSAPLRSSAPSADDVEAPERDTRKMATANTSDIFSTRRTLVLSGVTGVSLGQQWDVNTALVSIGRDKERQVHLPDESVSRLHAQIVRQPAGYFVTDLHSSNGTFVNGTSIVEPRMLADGDILRVGEIELRCALTGRGPSASTSAVDSAPASRADETTLPGSPTEAPLDSQNTPSATLSVADGSASRSTPTLTHGDFPTS